NSRASHQFAQCAGQRRAGSTACRRARRLRAGGRTAADAAGGRPFVGARISLGVRGAHRLRRLAVREPLEPKTYMAVRQLLRRLTLQVRDLRAAKTLSLPYDELNEAVAMACDDLSRLK